MYWTKSQVFFFFFFLCQIFYLSNGTALIEAIEEELGERVRQEISNDKEGKLNGKITRCMVDHIYDGGPK